MDTSKAIRVAVAANYTIRPVKNAMFYWAKKTGYALETDFSESYDVIAQLLDNRSNFYREGRSLIIIFFRFENCFASLDSARFDIKACDDFISKFLCGLHFANQNGVSPIIVIESPSSKKYLAEDISSELDDLRGEFKKRVDELPGVHFESQETLFDLYPMGDYHDEFAYSSALMPYTKECYAALGSIASRTLSSLIRKPYKVIVLDCDNTLWGGVAAEDGVTGLSIDDNYTWLQAYMVELCNKGFLLCLCSKNVEQDVWAVFDHYKGVMPLEMEHLVSSKINWKPKSANIRELSEELNLGLDSFILLDDNPAEINEVEAACPEVKCFQVPKDPNGIITFLKHLWAFDVPRVHGSDRNRTEYYKLERARRSSASEFSHYDEFLEHLKLELTFSDLSDDLMGRACQMMLRTNQFNFSGLKLNGLELARRKQNRSSKCTLVNAKDRFGDYGEVGCLVYSFANESIYLENFLLSCRALGKRVEFRIWEWLCKLAHQRGLTEIEICFSETPRNQPAHDFLLSLGIELSSCSDGRYIYEVPNAFNWREAYLTDSNTV